MKSSRLIISVAYSTLIHLLIGCSLQHQAPEELNTITGAFGFHFGEKIQSYQIKSEDDEVMVVEPTVIPRPNPLIERYVLLLDRENKRILEINGLNHSLSQRQCLKAKQKLVDSLKETYEFEITESLENLESRPKKKFVFWRKCRQIQSSGWMLDECRFLIFEFGYTTDDPLPQSCGKWGFRGVISIA